MAINIPTEEMNKTLEPIIYLDANATSWPKLPYLTQSLADKWNDIQQDPEILNIKSGFDSQLFYQSFKETLIKMFNIPFQFEYILHSGATEGLNIVQHFFMDLQKEYRDKILMNYRNFFQDISHNSAISVIKSNCKYWGYLDTNHDYKKSFLFLNHQSSFLPQEPDILKELLDNSNDCFISLDLSQSIYHGFNFALEFPNQSANKIAFTFGLHKKLGLFPGTGITIFNWDYQLEPSRLKKTILGGDNSSIPFNKYFYNTDTYYNSGTYNFVPFIFLQKILEFTDISVKPSQDTIYLSEQKRDILDFLHKYFLSNVPNKNIFKNQNLLTIFPDESTSLDDLIIHTYNFFEQNHPYAKVIYRAGRFCCDLWFEKNKKDGALRFSI